MGEAEEAKKLKEAEKKKKKKKQKEKLKNKMNNRISKDQMKKKGLLKDKKAVDKKKKSKQNTEALISNTLDVKLKRMKLQEKRKRHASFFLPSRGADRKRNMTYDGLDDLKLDFGREAFSWTPAKRMSITGTLTAPAAL